MHPPVFLCRRIFASSRLFPQEGTRVLLSFYSSIRSLRIESDGGIVPPRRMAS